MLEAWSVVVGNVTAGTAGDTNADETNRWTLFSYLLLLKQITANDMATKDSERENIIMFIYFEYEMDLDDRSNSAQFLLVF